MSCASECREEDDNNIIERKSKENLQIEIIVENQ